MKIMNKALVGGWIHLPKSLLSEDEMTAMRRHLTFLPAMSNSDDFPEPVLMYQEDDASFDIPVATPSSVLSDNVNELIASADYDLSIGASVAFSSRPNPDHPNVKDPEAQKRLMGDMITSANNELAFIVCASTGCVTGDTQYLSRTGWRSIDSYSGGDVLVYNKDTGAAHFEEPSEYIKLPATRWVSIKSKYGVSQVISPEHRMVVHNQNSGNMEFIKATDFVDRHNSSKYGTKLGIPSAFSLLQPVDAFPNMSEAELRLQVAVIADGYFASNTNRVAINLKKERKKRRLRELLNSAGVDYREVDKGHCANGYTIFYFNAPIRVKYYDQRFWECSYRELAIISDECFFWDGTIRGGHRGGNFFSTKKESAEFIQYALSSTGRRASIRFYDRSGEGRDKSYWVVASTNRVNPTLDKSSGREELRWEGASDGEYKYCFSVTTGALILRHNGTIFATGNTGKTICALNTIAELGRNAIVIVPTNYLAKQWADSAKAVLGCSDSDIGILQGSKFDIEGKKIVISIINSASMKDYPEWVYSHFGTLVVDECHRSASRVFSQAVPKFKCRYKIGLSATPKRKDGSDKIMHYHLGQIHALSSAKALFTKVEALNYRTHSKVWGNNHSTLVKCLTLDKRRNNLIVKIVLKLYSHSRNILVVSDSIQHLQNLMALCVEAGIPREVMGQFTGQRYLPNGKTEKVKSEELEYIKANSQIIFATYQMMKEGVDIPRLDAGIDATPRTDAIQLVGRIRRPYRNKPKPVWYTIVDRASKRLVGYYYKRKKEYLTSNMEVEEHDIK